jgi:pyruvate,water dikinase
MGGPHVSDRYVQFFDAADPDPGLLGGKCASLVTMTAAGMPVPPGFVITTALYDAFIEDTGLDRLISHRLGDLDPDDVRSVDTASAAIRAGICAQSVPDRLRQSVAEAWAALQERFDRPVPVAVRSSATAEDLPGASFAGQHDTHLWLVDEQDVHDRIRACWASLHNSRAVTYRLRHAIPQAGLSMAVAVQKMVSARAAGVAMTMNPCNGDRSKITIESSWGVAELLVSGQVTPDHIVVDKVLLCIVTEHLGDKRTELVPDPSRDRLVEVDVDPARRSIRSLTDTQVTAVAQLAKRAERHYGCPQDIEWALDTDLPPGQDLLLLQSRPETVHSSKLQPTDAPIDVPAKVPPTAGFDLSGITARLTVNLRQHPAQ